MKKGHRTVFQNAWNKKTHSHWKNKSVSKKRINSYEKRPQNRLLKCLKPKKQPLSLKKQFFLKKTFKFIKRPQNRLPKCLKPKKQTFSLKKQFCSKKTSEFIWKKATEPSSKMPEAKRINTFIEKTIPFQKKLINSYEKRPRNRSSKMPEAKKPTLSLKKQFCFKKAYITESAYIEYGIGNLTIFRAFQELKQKHT